MYGLVKKNLMEKRVLIDEVGLKKESESGGEMTSVSKASQDLEKHAMPSPTFFPKFPCQQHWTITTEWIEEEAAEEDVEENTFTLKYRIFIPQTP